jgi:hypothetical protein
MKAPSVKPVRCAIYTRVSTEHGLASIRAATCSKRSAKRTWRLRRLCPGTASCLDVPDSHLLATEPPDFSLED